MDKKDSSQSKQKNPTTTETTKTKKFNGCLKVTIVNCEKAPNPDRFCIVDPYVNLIFQGES
jgi:hypothetical protein